MYNIENAIKSYLEWAPFSLSVREISRINGLKILDQKESIFKANRILDVGCGDGTWWRQLYPEGIQKVHGIDVSKKEISLAVDVISAQCLDVTSSDFTEKVLFNNFDLIIGNCSLEHVYNIDKALINIHSVLEKGGVFILLVPTPHWALKGKSVKILEKISPRLSMGFSGLLNGFFQHWHLYNYRIWSSLLTNSGFQVKNIYGLGNSKAEFLFRLGLPTAFVSFLVKCITGKYLNYYTSPLIPNAMKSFLVRTINDCVDKKLPSSNDEDIFEYMIVCTK